MLAGELWVYEGEVQVQEVVAKAVERNVVQEDWESEEEVGWVEVQPELGGDGKREREFEAGEVGRVARCLRHGDVA